jgi:sulfatase maturation enzyme AslB (radical SAM superfamily)
MYFKLKSNVIFRNYESFGYVTDNRNFGYKHLNDDINDIGDKILSESGAVFISVLDKKAQSIDDIATKIKKYFVEVDIETIKNDARDLYTILEQDGFIISGETFQECNEKVDSLSSRKLVSENNTKNYFPLKNSSEKRTQDFFEEYYNGKPMLTNLHIEITSMCNERCIHCYIPHENKISHIQPKIFYDIIEQCKELKLLHLTLSGGEPMLHKNFCNFLRIINEYNFSVNVLSNLTLLTNEIIDEMKLNPLLGVQVSLYSMNPSIHDKITGIKGSFERTKRAIIKLIESQILLQISCPIGYSGDVDPSFR